MHRDVGMIEQERVDSRCFVAADVVADHVNLLRGVVGRHDLGAYRGISHTTRIVSGASGVPEPAISERRPRAV